MCTVVSGWTEEGVCGHVLTAFDTEAEWWEAKWVVCTGNRSWMSGRGRRVRVDAAGSG